MFYISGWPGLNKFMEYQHSGSEKRSGLMVRDAFHGALVLLSDIEQALIDTSLADESFILEEQQR
jgi:hypothetical protein